METRNNTAHAHTHTLLPQRKDELKSILPAVQKETIRKLCRLDLNSGLGIMGEPPLRICKQKPDPICKQHTHDPGPLELRN